MFQKVLDKVFYKTLCEQQVLFQEADREIRLAQ